MEHESIFIRPTDLFALPNALSLTNTPCMDMHLDHADLTLEAAPDDKLASYQSSPESTFSYLDGACFSPIDESPNHTESQILAMVRRSIHPHMQGLGALSALPFALDSLEAGLVTTYLSDYPEAAYGFSPTLQPHPMATILASTLQKQACLHFVIARAAGYRLSAHQFASSREQGDLEVAMITHRGEAIQSVRTLSGRSARGTEDLLMASIVGLGFLDSGAGAEDTALMHFKAARRMLKSMGGPLKFRNVLLSRALLHFECTHRPTSQSYLWDPEDFSHLHHEMNGFFGKLQSMWISLTGQNARSPQWSTSGSIVEAGQPLCHDLVLREGSVVRECLSRSPQDRSSPTQQDRQEMIFQLTSLLTICAVLVDKRLDPQAMQDYIDSVLEMIERSQVQGLPSNNIMWLLQINDHSQEHTKRIWAAAGWVWVLKHVNFNVQCMVRDWLMLFLTGKAPVRQLKLDSFAFSYAS